MKSIKAIIYYLLLLWLVIFSNFGYGQEYISNIRVFEMEDGLSHFEVSATFQDSRGFLWIGTRHGLNRFDGNEFMKWTKSDGGLTFDKILDIKEDDNGYLWLIVTTPWSNIGMDINLIDIETLEIISFKDKFGNLDIPLSDFNSFIKHPSNDILFTRISKPLLYSYTLNKGVQSLEFPNQRSSIFDYLPHDNTYSLVNKDNYFYLNHQGNILDSLRLNLKGKRLMSLNIDSDGHMLYYQHSIGVFKIINHEVKKVPFKDIEILAKYNYAPYSFSFCFAHRAIDNTYWFSFYGSNIMVFHPEKGLIYEFKESLKGIKSIYIDKSGIAWMIAFDGLIRVSLQESKFKHLLSQNLVSTQKLKIAHNSTISTRQIIKHKNQFHIASDPGLFIVDDDESYKNPRPEADALSILALDSNRIAYGYRNAVLIYENNELIHHHFYPMGAYWSLYQDKHDKLWIGSERYIALMPDLKTLPKVFENHQAFPAFLNSGFYQFFEKSDNEIWLASTKGIFVLDIKQNKITNHFSSKGKGKKYIPKDIIHHIYRDKEGIFWLSTTEGLVRWNHQTGESQIINAQTGLPNDVIYACYEDDYEHLWMSSNYGIIQLNKKTLQTNHYLPKDGLTHHEFNRISHLQDQDGTIYFGGINGVTYFHPKNFYEKQSQNIIPLEIVRFQQFNRKKKLLEDKTTDLLANNKIIFASHDLFFTLDFAILDYHQDNDALYTYKIEGFDQDWNYIRHPSLRINKLPYGRYILKVKGQTHKGTFSEDMIEIPIHVKRPFYFTSWFILLSSISLIALIYSIYIWRTKQFKIKNQQLEALIQDRTQQLQEDKLIIEKQANQLQKLDQLKSKFFVNVSHELRTPLTLILSPIQILLQKINRFAPQEINLLSTVEHNAFKLLQLTEEVLQLSSLEAGQQKLQEEEVFFYNYFLQIFHSFQPLASNKTLEYHIDYQVSKSLIIQLDKTKFEHIITNLISNAIKYTPENGSIHVFIEEQNNQLLIQVTDTGIGIPEQDLPFIFDRYYQTESQEKWTSGTGIGLALAKELSHFLNGTLTVESQFKKGSTFILSLPITKIKNASSTTSYVFSEKNQYQLPAFTDDLSHFDESRPTILVVEDNLGLKQFLVQILSVHYNIITAANGVEAIEKLTKSEEQLANNTPIQDHPSPVIHYPSLIISDVMMPKMNGFELLEHLKNHSKWINIPIIFLSAKTNIEDKIKALTIGIDDYITKPFAVEELLARINNSLRNATARVVTSKEDEALQINKALDTKDLNWLEEINQILEKELANSIFNIDDLSHQSSMSKRQLYRKIKSVTGLTPNKYVREYKLHKSRQLLEDGKINTLSEVAHAVGFDTPHYFSTIFEKRFGKKPQLYFQRTL